MSWLFSRALVAVSSGDISSDGVLYAPSSATPTPQVFSLRVRTTDVCLRFPFGMTCGRLTDDRGEAVLTWCLAASPVKTSPPQAKAQASKEAAPVCGPRWRGSSVKWDHDSSSWKTAPSSPDGVSMSFSGTWPRWGVMRDGVCSEHATPARLTSASACGSWLTPTRNDSQPSGIKAATMMLRALAGEVVPGMYHRLRSQVAALALQAGEGFGPLNPTWVEWLMGWPLGWTDLRASAMDRFQQWRRSHGVA